MISGDCVKNWRIYLAIQGFNILISIEYGLFAEEICEGKKHKFNVTCK